MIPTTRKKLHWNKSMNVKTCLKTLSECLLAKVTLSENCKFGQAKLVDSVIFASASYSIRSTDTKLQEVQCNMSKVTGCFIKFLSQLPYILKTNGNHKDQRGHSNHPRWHQNVCACKPKFSVNKGKVPIIWC